jgi:hypothetical protein
MDESATQKDSEGYINGFIYTQDEKTTIVKAFESYANLLFSFNANLNNKVSNVQGMIGSLEKCKPESSTRLLQKTSGFTTKPSGKKQSGEKPSGKKPSGEKPRKLQDNTGSKLPINGTKPSGSEFKPSGPRPSGSEFKPSGPRPSGGKPKGKDGRPEGKIPEDLNKLKTEFVNTLSTKGGNWKLLGDTINTNMTPESGYKPNGSLQRAILTRIQGDSKKVIENELHKCKTNQNSTNEYLFYCKSGACFCEGLCPEDLNKIKSITLASNSQIINNMLARLLQISNNSATPTSMAFPSGSGKAPINQDDNVGEYTLAILALGGKRYSYFQALMSLSGAVLDFDAPGKSLGKSNTEGERKCKNALFSNSTNVETDKDCRGNLNEKCSKGMDGACKGAGLYERLVNRPLSEAALPVQCDNTYPTYSIDNCFNWLEPLIIKNTLSFSLRGFKELPMSIDRSFNKSYSLRELQSSVQVTVDPVTKSDSQAVIPSSLSKLESNLINIDGATAISAPSVGTYIQAFNEESIKLELSQKYFSFTFITLLIFLGLLI